MTYINNKENGSRPLEEVGNSSEAPERPWSASEEGEVFIPSRLSGVSGALHQCSRGAYITKESQSHIEGTQASERPGVALIPGSPNYYAKFIPNFSLILHRLNNLL